MLRIWQKLKEIFNLNPCSSKKIFILQIFHSIINHSFTSSELNHVLELIFWWDVEFFNWNLAKKCFLHWIEIPVYFPGSRERWLTFPEIPGSQKVREILVSSHDSNRCDSKAKVIRQYVDQQICASGYILVRAHYTSLLTNKAVSLPQCSVDVA